MSRKPRIVVGAFLEKSLASARNHVLMINLSISGSKSRSPRIPSRLLTFSMAAAVTLAGCAQVRNGFRSAPSEATSEIDQVPFGGAPAVEIPPQAKAMGAFLQAEVATEEGDR